MGHLKLVVSSEMQDILAKRFSEVDSKTLLTWTEEFLKFFVLAVDSEPRNLPISVELDNVWHVFILETEEYLALCDQAGRFVHHSVKRSDIQNALQQLDDDLWFVVAYLEKFQTFPKEAIILWPALERLATHFNMNTDQLMNFARKLIKHKRRRSG